MNKMSVVLMVYNRKDYYKEALDSLKAQTDMYFDLVIVSNIEIEYNLSVFRDVLVIPAPVDIHEEYVDGKVPGNLLEAYTYGMHVTKGDIIAFLEDDDIFVPNKISYLKKGNIKGYYHNDYYDLGSKEQHNNGKGFNCSCIALYKPLFEDLLAFAHKYPKLNYIPDSAIYWYSLEHDIPVNIDSFKLTYYRHKPMKKLYETLPESLGRQMQALDEAEKAFKSPVVKDIIREVKIQDYIYFSSIGDYHYVSFTDLIWLMKRPVIQKPSKVVSYFLSLPLWHGIGVKWMDRIRVQREVEK